MLVVASAGGGAGAMLLLLLLLYCSRKHARSALARGVRTSTSPSSSDGRRAPAARASQKAPMATIELQIGAVSASADAELDDHKAPLPLSSDFQVAPPNLYPSPDVLDGAWDETSNTYL